MGLFQQRPEETQNEWALPSEPVDRTGAADRLDAARAIDPLEVGIGAPQYTSIVFPVAPPAPEAADVTDADPGDD